MAISIEKRRSAFEAKTVPSVVIAAAGAFGVSALLPYADPFALGGVVMGAALTYASAHHAVVGYDGGRRVRLVLMGVCCVSGMLTLVLGLIALIAVSTTLNELKQPCQSLRASLLKQPDSVKADTYSALRCPANFW